MKKLFCLILFSVSCSICNSQNLVPNGDFEGYTMCPTALGNLSYAIPWINPFSNMTSSPDYYNQCGTTSSVGVPNNYFGYQNAHSGLGYAGIHRLFPSLQNYREYIESPLSMPLIAGACYDFNMYINLCDESDYTAHNIGVYFSDSVISGIAPGSPTLLPYTPQISNIPGNTPDTLNWTLVSGNYIANGGERFIIIGNFVNDTMTDTIYYNNQNATNFTYVYIDDVCLTLCTTPCFTSINEQTPPDVINIFPNPMSDRLYISNISNEPAEIILYDIVSRKILQQEFTSSASLNVEQLSKGIYIYEVRNKKGLIKQGKIVKE